MKLVFVTAFVTVSSIISFKVPSGLDVRCPSKYTVQVTTDKTVNIQVVDNKTECDRIARTRQMKRADNNNVNSQIALVYKDGQYRANITWDFSLRGKRLPRKFLMNLTFYDITDYHRATYLNNTCLLLRLIGNRRVKTIGPVQFYFDCLPLLAEPNLGLVVQLWSYSSQGPPCRTMRSLPEKKDLCGTDIQCSKEYSFPISKDAHSYRQCKCYAKYHGVPKLDWNYNHTDNRFHIHFTNVPSYLEYADIDIVDSTSEVKLADNINVLIYDHFNGELHVKSSELGPGEYTVYVCAKVKIYLKCEDPGDTESLYKREIDDNCGDMDYFVYSNQKLNVSYIKEAKSSDVILEEIKLETILGIASGVLLTVIVTTAIFIRCRKRQFHDSTSIEMSELSSQQIPLTNESHLPVLTNNRQAETGFSLNTTSEDVKYQVMLLYQPDAHNQKHMQRVEQFAQTLKDKYGVTVERETTGNWHDFAESAFVTFVNVVFIISSGLYNICHYYLNSEPIPEDLLGERNHDIVPCVVLNKMKNMIEHVRGQSDGLERRDICIHIVDLDSEGRNDQLLQLFLNDYSFLKSGRYCCLYKFCGQELDKEDLTPLVSRLQPRVYKGMPQNLQIQLMDLNRYKLC